MAQKISNLRKSMAKYLAVDLNPNFLAKLGIYHLKYSNPNGFGVNSIG